MNPKYPIYIVSKGRWKTRLTSKALDRINVPYYIVVEAHERDEYASVIDPAKVLVLPSTRIGFFPEVSSFMTFCTVACSSRTWSGTLHPNMGKASSVALV